MPTARAVIFITQMVLGTFGAVLFVYLNSVHQEINNFADKIDYTAKVAAAIATFVFFVLRIFHFGAKTVRDIQLWKEEVKTKRLENRILTHKANETDQVNDVTPKT